MPPAVGLSASLTSKVSMVKSAIRNAAEFVRRPTACIHHGAGGCHIDQENGENLTLGTWA